MVIIVLELDAGLDILDVIQVRNIGSLSHRLNALLLNNINIIDCTEILSSPSQASTSSATSLPSHLYYSHSWIPHNIEISLNESGELSVKEINTSKNDSSTDTFVQTNVIENGENDNKIVSDDGDNNHEENSKDCDITSDAVKDNKVKSTNQKISTNIQKVQYGLSAVICYVDDKSNEERRNIVALLQVGPGYHKRSTGSGVSQWYILNDIW